MPVVSWRVYWGQGGEYDMYLNPEAHPMTAAQLVAVRAALNMTQAEFGRLLGIARPNISAMERGKRPVPGMATACIERMAESDSARAAVIRKALRRAAEGE